MNKITTEDFIIRSKEIYGNIFDYSETEYINHSTKIKIICPEHGIIGRNHSGQTPTMHYKGKGCFYCARKQSGLKKASTSDIFIKKAKDIHGGLYDYSEVEYKNKRNKVMIKCKKHDIYLGKNENGVLPSSHLQGHGCSKCQIENLVQNKPNVKEFFIKAKKVHPHIDVSMTIYKTAKIPIEICCPKHNKVTFCTPNAFLRSPSGCPQCSFDNTHVGYNETTYFKPYLKKLIQHEIIPQYFVPIIKTPARYCVDFYIPSLNICIEYDEDYHRYNKIKDKKRQTYIEEKLGCEFIRIDDKKFMEDNSYAYTLLSPLLG